jgi:hypothetical protein
MLNFEPHPAELLRETKTADGEQRYCTVPFRFMAMASESLKPCTWLRHYEGKNIVSTNNLTESPSEIWRGPAFDNVRRAIKDGSYHHCHLEFCPQYKGEKKYFFTLPELEEKFPDIAKYIRHQDHSHYEVPPEEINIGYDTHCNLDCPYCNRKLLPRLSPAQKNQFRESIYEFSSCLKEIFLAGMGDPFATKHYIDFLQTLDVDRFSRLERIVIQTNALMWNEDSWSRIPEGARSKIRGAIVSIDGASKEVFEKNRVKGRFDVFLKNMEFIGGLRKSGHLHLLQFTYVYQANNFFEMLSMLELARKYSVDRIVFCRISDWNMNPVEFAKTDVGNPSHPLHRDLLKHIALVRENIGNLEVVITQ